MSPMNSESPEYPRHESSAKLTAPGVPVELAKATATRLYFVGVSRSLRPLSALLQKSCQYPVMTLAGRLLPWLVPTVGVGVAVGPPAVGVGPDPPLQLAPGL